MKCFRNIECNFNCAISIYFILKEINYSDMISEQSNLQYFVGGGAINVSCSSVYMKMAYTVSGAFAFIPHYSEANLLYFDVSVFADGSGFGGSSFNFGFDLCTHPK